MSKHLIEINFDELKFNLYTLLSVPQNASEKKIKKAYRKLVIQFHPDKNNIIDEEIFNHLTLANQILTNSELRKKYDLWLMKNADEKDHDQLRQGYQQNVNHMNPYFPSNTGDAKVNYVNKSKALDEKHGVTKETGSVMENFKKYKSSMKSKVVSKEDFIKFGDSKNEFNNCFDNRKTTGKFDNQIIKRNKDESIMEYNNNFIGDEFVSVDNYNLLYSEESAQTNEYSSLDTAFTLQPKIEFKEENVSKKMKEYKNLSEDFSKIKF